MKFSTLFISRIRVGYARSGCRGGGLHGQRNRTPFRGSQCSIWGVDGLQHLSGLPTQPSELVLGWRDVFELEASCEKWSQACLHGSPAGESAHDVLVVVARAGLPCLGFAGRAASFACRAVLLVSSYLAPDGSLTSLLGKMRVEQRSGVLLPGESGHSARKASTGSIVAARRAGR